MIKNKISNNFTILSSLILFSLIIRFPFFSTGLINGDEITFVIMGNWVMSGNLAYDGLTDFKTPLLFYLYGILSNILENNLYSLRVFGSVLIGISSFIYYKILEKLEIENCFIASVFLIGSITFFYPSGQSVMSEHLVLLPLVLSFLLIIQSKNNLKFFLIGILLGISVSIRPNLVYLLFLISFYYLYLAIIEKNLKIGFFFIGVFLVAFLNILPYLIQNKINLFLEGAVYTPALYTSIGGNSFNINIVNLIRQGLLPHTDIFFTFKLIFWFFSFLSFFYCLIKLTKNNKFYFFSLAFFIMIAISIIFSGHGSSHYLYQLIPFAFLIFLIVLKKFNYSKNIYYKIYIFFFISFISVESFNSYKIYFYGTNQLPTEQKIFNKITKSKKQVEVYAYKYHILYLMLNNYPRSKYLHPPNIFKKEYILKNDGTNAVKEGNKFFIGSNSVDYIIIEEPLIIFLNNFYKEFNRDYLIGLKLNEIDFKKNSQIKEIYNNYLLDETIDKTYIYKKINLKSY